MKSNVNIRSHVHHNILSSHVEIAVIIIPVSNTMYNLLKTFLNSIIKQQINCILITKQTPEIVAKKIPVILMLVIIVKNNRRQF